MSNIAKSAIGLMIITLLGKILGFGRELVLGSTYGTTGFSDAYLVAMNIPTVIVASIGMAISTTFIPLYCDIKDDKKANLFTNNIFNIIIIISIIFSIIGVVFAEPIVKVFAVGFKGDTLTIAVKLTRILMIGIVFTALSNLMTAYLQSKECFIVPGLVTVPFNIIIIISIILSSKSNPYIIGYGTLIAMMSQFLMQYPFTKKNGYKYSKYLNLKDENLKKMIVLLAPVFIGVAVGQINATIDRTLASSLGDGRIAALNYAYKLNGFIMAMFITSIVAVIYPMFSKLSNDGSKDEFSDVIVKSVNSVTLLIMPITIGAIVLATPIVRLLFERGEFDAEATKMTAVALAFYSIGMLGHGIRDVLGRAFYALKDTKTPMINGVITMLINIILNLILIKYMGHAGLAFATSISALIAILLLFIKLNKKIGYYGEDKIIKVIIKSLVASLTMGWATMSIYKYIIGNMGISLISQSIALSTSVLIGAVVYAVIILILKVEEVQYIIYFFKTKIKK